MMNQGNNINERSSASATANQRLKAMLFLQAGHSFEQDPIRLGYKDREFEDRVVAGLGTLSKSDIARLDAIATKEPTPQTWQAACEVVIGEYDASILNAYVEAEELINAENPAAPAELPNRHQACRALLFHYFANKGFPGDSDGSCVSALTIGEHNA